MIRFNTTNTNINSTVRVPLNVDLFIIPNTARPFNDLQMKYQGPAVMATCAANNIQANPEKEPMVQMWFVCDELGCENMVDHGFTLRDSKGRSWYSEIPSSYLPMAFFTGHKEGDTFKILYPVTIGTGESDDGDQSTLTTTNSSIEIPDDQIIFRDGTNLVNVMLEMTVTLSQSKYRYCRFGNFENVLERVTGVPFTKANDGPQHIKVDAECFIIPNHGGYVRQFLEGYRDRAAKFAAEMCALSGVEAFDPEKDQLVQIWFTSSDLHCENLVDHTAVGYDSQNRVWSTRIPFAWIPAKLFEGHKEGDTVTVACPVQLELHPGQEPQRDWMVNLGEIEGEGQYLQVILEMQVKLNQREYRYSRHGNFEDVLTKVLG